MSSTKAVILAFAVTLSSGYLFGSAIAEENQAVNDGEIQPRHFLKNKLCNKLGFLCGGGFGGYQGFGGYNQGGFPTQYPPINIGISQSQSSSNAGGGTPGYGGYGEYNNYYQNNYGYPGQGYNGYPGQGYNVYPGLGYNGYPGYIRPVYFGNGIGNSQFQGNYIANGGGPPFNGWNGFSRPYGAFYDEADETRAGRGDYKD